MERDRINKKNKKKGERLYLRIDSDIKSKYISFCKEKGQSYGLRIRNFIDKELNVKKQNN